MDSRQLRYFAKVIETGNLTRAAAVLHVAQSAVSMHMRHLEQELGVALLVRSRAGVRPTAHGQLLFEHARTILRQFDQARQEVVSLGKEPHGEVALGIPATVAPVLVRPLLEYLQRRAPLVTPHIVEAMSGYLLEWLHSGRLDAAILFDSQELSGLHRTVLGVESMYLVGPPDAFAEGQVVTMAELSRYPLIIPGRMHGMNLLIRRAAGQAGVALHIRVEVDSVAELVSLAKGGYGYTVLARMGFHRELEEGKVSVAHIENPQMERTLVSATVESRPLTQGTVLLMEGMETILRAFTSGQQWTRGSEETDARQASV
jgi:LysR family nitrogen assimilation transcriptional regulator